MHQHIIDIKPIVFSLFQQLYKENIMHFISFLFSAIFFLLQKLVSIYLAISVIVISNRYTLSRMFIVINFMYGWEYFLINQLFIIM